MSKILSVIPVLSGKNWLETCLASIKSDILIIDNNADDDIKEIIKDRDKIVNKKNEYVNFAWNQGIEYFLDGDWEYLAIINSDLLLVNNWEDFIEVNFEDKVLMIPRQVKVENFKNSINDNSYIENKGDCFQGVFILLDKKMADFIYPIPKGLKLWFGDAWIWHKLKSIGYEQRIYNDFICVHGNSISVSTLKNEAITIIAEDRKEWNKIQNIK